MFSQELVDIKQEPPDEVDEDLASILNSDIHLTEVSHDRNDVPSLNESEVIDLLSDEKGTISNKDANSKSLKANLRCKFSYCTFRAKKISELERHEEKHNIPGSYYECKYCKFVTTIHQRLQEHEAKHTNTKPFKCSKCSYRSRYKADVYHHGAKHLKEKKFKCPNRGCSFITKWRKNIYHHLLTHTENRPHECNICDYKFKRLQDLKYHLYRHNDEKPIACDQCDFRCKTNYELGCHKLKHSSVRRFPCTFPGCQKRTKTKSDLTKHMKIHSKNWDYLCPICGKAFYMRNSLTKHMERHGDARNYKCGLCTKDFKTKSTLRAHMQVHSGVKPWTCDICSRDFLNKWNMLKHKETHGENRPFKCPICPYGAREGEHLLAHIGTMHGNSFAYYCEICKKPWRRFSQLQVHMKRMHKGALKSSFGSSMKMDIKLEPGTDGDINTGCDIISVKKIDPNKKDQFKHKRGRPPKIKKEPVDIDEYEGQRCADPVADVVESFVSQKEPNSDAQLPVQVKHEIPSDIESAKIVCFGDFRLPLATKGFPFNYDKNGKKPKSWFMNPENMHGKAADRQQAYLEKKERDFERRYGRKLGWHRLRLRKKPKPGVSYSSVLNKAEQDDTKCSLTKMEGRDETNDSDKQKKYENRQQIIKKQDPMELLIKGRQKLILMRKIRRRQKRWKQRMAEIMPNDDELTDEEIEEPSNQTVANSGEDIVNEIKTDEKQETEVNSNECSSDQDDNIPLSRLKTSEDLDDLPLSMFRNKTSAIKKVTKANNKRQKQKQHIETESNLSNPPLKARKKRKLENAVSEQNKNIKKRKSCQETSAVLNTNFYSGSVRILGKTLVALSESNTNIPEKTEDTDLNNKNTISSSPVGNDAPLKLKGKKIENIVEKLKAKKFNTEEIGNATALNCQGKIKKKVGRPKGSKNKIKVNNDTENRANSSVSTPNLVKARKGKQKTANINNRTEQIKPSDDNAAVLISEKPGIQKDITNKKSNNTHQKSIKLSEPNYIKNKGNSVEDNISKPIIIRKVGRPKGSKIGANKMRCLKKSKPGPGRLKKSKQINAEPKPTGTILTLQSGKVYELKPGNIWDLTDKVSNTDVECTKSTQTPIQKEHIKIHQSSTIVPSGKQKSAELLSEKCKEAISVQLKRKLLDKLATQKTPTRVLSEDSDSVLGVPSTTRNSNHPEPKRKVGRPKGSKTKLGNKVLTSTVSNKAQKKLNSVKKMVSKTKDTSNINKQKKMKNKTTNKQRKKSIEITNLKVTKVKQKYKQQLKNNKSGTNKICSKSKTVKNCLKKKSTKGNKKTSQKLKRKKIICGVDSVKTKNKTIKQKANQQVWYIDIERETSDDTTSNIPLAQSGLTCPVFMQKFTDLKQPMISSTVAAQGHISIHPVKSEQLEDMVNTEPVLIQLPTHISHIMTTTENDDLSIYREHAKAWGVVKEESHSSNGDSAVSELNDLYEEKDRRQVQFGGINTQNSDQTECGYTTVKDTVNLPALNYARILQRCYQKADIDPHCVDTSDLVNYFSTVQETATNSESFKLSELPDHKNDNPFTNHSERVSANNSDCDNDNNNSADFLTSINHGSENVENNINYDCSKANVDNSVPVLSSKNFNVFRTSGSHMENSGSNISNSNSEILISSDLTENSSVEIGQTASHEIAEMVKRENYAVMTQIQNTHHIHKLHQTTHDMTLFNYDKTDENKAFIITKKGCEVDVAKSNNVCVTSSNDSVDLPKDSFAMACLYSEGVHEEFTADSKNVIHSFQDDTMACSSVEIDNQIHMFSSSLGLHKDDLSYHVVLADSDTEQLESDMQAETKY